MTLVVAVTVAGLGLPVLNAATAPTAAAAGPLSGAIGLGGGVSGSIDERTGLFSVSVPVVSVAGAGTAGVDFSLAWNQGRATELRNRSGFGAGWGLDVSYVDPTVPITVYPANGGAYQFGGPYASNLQNYPLADLVFERQGGTLPARPGVAAPVAYSFTLTHDEGRTDHFDRNGNLVARTDRFGNRSDLTWRSRGNEPVTQKPMWAPTSIVDSYGLISTFDYGTLGAVTISAPARSDGVVARTRIAFDNNNRVTSVTDPNGLVAGFGYGPIPATNNQVLVNRITSPAGARTTVTYAAVPNNPGLYVTQSVVSADAAGKILGPARVFSINPSQNQNGQNYRGYPRYQTQPGDGLFASGDASYLYRTSIASCVVDQVPAPATCPNSATSTVTTYDSQHRQVQRQIYVGQLLVQNQASEFPRVRPVNVPGNYARPTASTVEFEAASPGTGALADAPGKRSSSTSRTYDDLGRVVSEVNETGATVQTVYDSAFGLVTRVTTTGTDGSKHQIDHTLTEDKKAIKSGTTSTAASGQALAATSTTSYTYDTSGQLASRTMTWAPGAQPGGDSGGPDLVRTTFTSVANAAARTRTVSTTTADGTTVAATDVSVLDLVHHQPVKITDSAGRVTQLAYDAGGRRTTFTAPGGLVTSTAYNAATGTAPATQTLREPDGHVTQTVLDALGRIVRVTDNVSQQAFVTSATARTVSTTTYSADGRTVVGTDQSGRSTTSTLDPLGRLVSRVGPTGIRHVTSYDDVANTITRRAVPRGDSSSSRTLVTVSGYDNANREISDRTTYSDAPTTLAYPATTTTYDGIGRVSELTESDLQGVPDYDAAITAPETLAVTPLAADAFPGPKVTSSRTGTLAGSTTQHSLQAADDPEVSRGTQATYDDAGRLLTSADPLGRTTSFTYTIDGRVQTRTTPTGTVVTNTYDDESGQLLVVSAEPRTGPTQTVTHTYVPPGQPGAGQVRSVTDGTATVTLGYDADQHVVRRSYSDGTATSASYTDAGRLDTTTDVTGAVTSYGYDDLGRVTSAKQVRDGAVLASVGYTYDGMSRVLTTTRGNGLTTTNSWTARNQLATQRTTTADGSLVEEHAYGYDSHGNITSETDTTPSPGGCRGICDNTANTSGTWTTTYAYDAYDHLVSSATYPGAVPEGAPTTKTTYDVNVAGDVVGSISTTRRVIGTRPVTTTSTTVNTMDESGQLTARKVGGNTDTQAFDDDGRLTRSFSGATTGYDAFDRPTTHRRGGSTTTYASWPDGTRRSATTVDASGSSSSVAYHYAVDGSLVNDTTTDPTAGSVSASYLMNAGREARTLQSGVTAVGTVPDGAPAATTTGTGVGYLLRDRHSSVTALVDATGVVTNTYEYTDYGAPALLDGRAGSLVGSRGAPGNRSNPFGYLGATLGGAITDGASGLIVLPARSYDPGQGRFTTRDTEDLHNRYQAFSANPVNYVDATGQFSISDILVDVGMALAFTVAAVATGGAAIPAAAAVFGAAEGAITAAAVATVVSTAVGTVAAATGAAAASLRVADDVDDAVTGKHFLTSEVRDTLTTVENVSGAVAGVSGLVSAGASAAGEAVEAVEASDIATGQDVAPADEPTVIERDAAPLNFNDEGDLISNLFDDPTPVEPKEAPAADPQPDRPTYQQPSEGGDGLRQLSQAEAKDLNTRVITGSTESLPPDEPETAATEGEATDDYSVAVLGTGTVTRTDFNVISRVGAGIGSAVNGVKDSFKPNEESNEVPAMVVPRTAATGSTTRPNRRALVGPRLRAQLEGDVNTPDLSKFRRTRK